MVDSSKEVFEKDGEHRVKIYTFTIINFNIAYLSYLSMKRGMLIYFIFVRLDYSYRCCMTVIYLIIFFSSKTTIDYFLKF